MTKLEFWKYQTRIVDITAKICASDPDDDYDKIVELNDQRNKLTKDMMDKLGLEGESFL